MRRYILLLLAVMGMTFSSCTHNNGDIGPWFGQWKITSILIDGNDDEHYQGNLFISFQAGVVQIVEVISDMRRDSCWGSWKESDGSLILDFNHADNESPESDWRYTPPASTHFAKDIVDLRVVKSESRSATLTYAAPDGHLYTYTLKKWG